MCACDVKLLAIRVTEESLKLRFRRCACTRCLRAGLLYPLDAAAIRCIRAVSSRVVTL